VGSELTAQQIRRFLAEVGNRLQSPAVLLVLGGSGLGLLGNTRPTLDLDFDGEEKAVDEFRGLLEQLAKETQIELEAVPLHRFIPLPHGAMQRHIPIGEFGLLRVMVFDPYSIALSKLDRGFDSDIEDITFLFRHGFVDPGVLDSMVDDAAASAVEYDLDPAQMRARLKLAREDWRKS